MGGRTRLHICGDTRRHLAHIGRLGCHVVDLESLAPLTDARQQMGPSQILLGNANPVTVLRNGTPDLVTRSVARCHADAGARYIVGAGCEIPRDTPDANLRALVAYAHGHRP